MPTAIKVPSAKNLCSARIKHKQMGVVLSRQRQVFASVGAGDRSLDRALNDFGFGKAKTVAFVGEDRSPHSHTLITKLREDPFLPAGFFPMSDEPNLNIRKLLAFSGDFLNNQQYSEFVWSDCP